MDGDHSHPVDAVAVETSRNDALEPEAAEELRRLLVVLCDGVRLRALFALHATDELCVGDLALALDISQDQSSYALRQLRAAGLVLTRREGRVVYYRLADAFPHELLDHCLRKLLAISRRKDPT